MPCRGCASFGGGRFMSIGHDFLMSGVETKSQMLLAKVTIMLILGLIALGLVWYGFSRDVLLRIWHDAVDRPNGPMAFRFVLQPAMAALMALRDGIVDART